MKCNPAVVNQKTYCESIGIEIAVIHNLLKNLRVRAETGGGPNQITSQSPVIANIGYRE